jgi:hypothetical protein
MKIRLDWVRLYLNISSLGWLYTLHMIRHFQCLAPDDDPIGLKHVVHFIIFNFVRLFLWWVTTVIKSFYCTVRMVCVGTDRRTRGQWNSRDICKFNLKYKRVSNKSHAIHLMYKQLPFKCIRSVQFNVVDIRTTQHVGPCRGSTSRQPKLY